MNIRTFENTEINLKMVTKIKHPRINQGKIKVYKGNKLRVVTFYKGEETIDYFTFEEVIEFINNKRKNNKQEENLTSECCEAEVESEYYEDEGAIIYFCKKCGEYCEVYNKK